MEKRKSNTIFILGCVFAVVAIALLAAFSFDSNGGSLIANAFRAFGENSKLEPLSYVVIVALPAALVLGIFAIVAFAKQKKKDGICSAILAFFDAVIIGLIALTISACLRDDAATLAPAFACSAALALVCLSLVCFFSVQAMSAGIFTDKDAGKADTKAIEDKIDALNVKMDELIKAVKNIKVNNVAAAVVPAPAPVDDEADRDQETVVDEATGQTYIVRYNKSHEAKLALAKPEINDYYNEVKNYILSFGANSRVSWKYDAFNVGHEQVAKLSIKGKTLSIYVALKPKAYVESKYHAKDVSKSKTYEATPTQMKIRSPRAVKFAKELVDDVMAPLGLKSSGVDTGDFRVKPRKFNTLLKNELIKKSKSLVK